MNLQNIACQNCKNNFTIEPEDFNFYEKIKVPPPTFCPECRLQRRLAFRNERSLHKRKCDLCKKDIMAMYPSGASFPVYCRDCWYGDGWNPMDYGKDYDFGKTFFAQVRELQSKVPRLHLFQRNSPNSQFSNIIGESKNVYLGYSIVESEYVYYSKSVDRSAEVFDSLFSKKLKQCYENVYGDNNYNSHFLLHVRDCLDSWFLFDCVNCRHCFLSANLRNQEYVIRGKKYSKEDYKREIEKMNLGSAAAVQKLREEFMGLAKRSVHKYANILKATNSSGNNILNAKNTHYCFDAYNVEDLKYCHRVLDMTNSMDTNYTGLGSELIYEYNVGGKADYNVHFSVAALDGLRDSEYTDYCFSSFSLFACIALRNKQNCIFNKQYSESEYKDLRSRIITHMNDAPYVDRAGRTYRYGEFFPIELSPHAYNETIAQEYWALSKDEVLSNGYAWREPDTRGYQITLQPENPTDHINEVKEDILNQVVGCAHKGQCKEQCTTAFKIIPDELQFYRKIGIPLPRLCPNCRHYARLGQIEPMKLWHRQCVCDYKIRQNSSKHAHHPEGRCPNEFETSYAPERPEVVYCEQCYNAEVV